MTGSEGRHDSRSCWPEKQGPCGSHKREGPDTFQAEHESDLEKVPLCHFSPFRTGYDGTFLFKYYILKVWVDYIHK